MHEEALEVLPRLLAEHGIERPVLVGHSDGASIALIHASEHPVARLVLLAPHVFVEDVSVAEHRRGARDVRDDRPARAHGPLPPGRGARPSGCGTTSGSRPSSATGTSRTCSPRVTAPTLADPGRARPVRDAGADRRDRARRARAVARQCSTAATRRTSKRRRRRCARRWRSCERASSRHFVVPFERSFDAHYGLEYLEPTRGRVTHPARALLGADGTVSSGVYAAIAESLASTGTAVEVVPEGLIPSGLNNSTQVVGELRDGVLEAPARCRARGARRVAVGRRDRSAGRRRRPRSRPSSIAIRQKRV